MDLRELFERVVRHRVLVASTLVLGALVVALVVLHTGPRYVATSTIIMVAEPPGQQNVQVPTSATKPILSADLPTLVQSATVLTRVSRQLGSGEPAALGKRVVAKVDPGSNVMPIRFTAPSSAEAVRGANIIADEVTRYYRFIATTRFDSLASDLRSQIADARTKLRRDDEALAAAASAYPFIDTTAAGQAATESAYARLVALKAERGDAQAAAAGSRAAAEAEDTLLRSLRPLASAQIAEEDPEYRTLRNQYARDVDADEGLHARYSQAYPGLRELDEIVAKEAKGVHQRRNRIDKTPPAASVDYARALQTVAAADAGKLHDEARLRVLDAQVSTLERTLGAGSTSAHIAAIRRERDAAAETYSVLSARLAATLADRAEAASTGSVVVGDRAVYATRSPLSMGLLVAALLAVFVVWLAFTIPFALESVDKRFRRRVTVEALYGAPVVGSVL